MAPRRPLLALLVLAALTTPLLPGAAAQTPEIVIRNFAYSPNPLTVDPGATVQAVNRDGAPHSVSHAQFDSGVLDQDESGTFTAPTTPGEYAYVCSVHGSSMGGTLVVRSPPATTPASSTPPPSTTPSPPTEPTPTTSTPVTTTPASTTPASSTPVASTPLPTTTSPATSTPVTNAPATTSAATTQQASTPTGATPATTGAASGSDAATPGPGVWAILGAAGAAVLVLGRGRPKR